MPNHQIDRESLFFENLPDGFVLGEDAAQLRLVTEYGAVFVARGGVVAPDRVVFKDEEEVDEFQSRLDIMRSEIGGLSMELQRVAMESLLAAISEAATAGLSITPSGSDSARRNYQGTVELWHSRVEPALIYWAGNGRISADTADAIRRCSPYEQVPAIFELEEEGIFFAKDLSKSIIYSVAPPGASQHLALLAFDVSEFEEVRVREILAKHFWYQTVVSDLPHFTFLGVAESKLTALGLKEIANGERKFWVPDV